MGVIAEMGDNVAVMYAGQIVEYTDVSTLFETQLHPYTEGLLAAIPVLGEVRDTLAVIPGSRAQPDQPAAGLQVPPALPVCEGDLHAAVTAELQEVAPGHKVRCYMRLPETQDAVGRGRHGRLALLRRRGHDRRGGAGSRRGDRCRRLH